MASDITDTPYGPMPSHYTETTLGAVCGKEGVQTGPFGSQLHKEDYVAVGTPIVTVEHLGDNRFTHQNLPMVSAQDKDRLSKYTLKAGDIVFSRVGSVDRRALVRPEEDGWMFSGRCLRIRINSASVDSLWLSHFFGLESFREYIRAVAVGATMPSINTKILSDVPLFLPPISQQRSTAALLGTIDDRIDLLRQTNATLEAIAQALFKSWFVDFDPVRAKMDGREPEGMDADTAALFPSEFEESELGFIPKGWSAGTLGDLSALNASKWNTKQHPDWLSYIDLSGVTKNRIEPPTEYRFDDAPSRARHHLRDGDTIIGTVRPGNRAFAFISEPSPTLTGSTGFAVLSPKSPDLSSFVYLAATRDEAIERLENLADGGAYPAVRPSIVAATPCVVPQPGVLNEFSDITRPLLNRIAQNESCTRSLSKIRDTLLPRLISGKLRLPEAEAAVEETAE